MGIGTSDGQYFENETDYVFDQFSSGQQTNFETKLSSQEESKYQDWKQTYAPNDSGFDYDFRGAFKAGVEPDATTNHWPDTYKKPNHPTFSDQSQYAKDAPELAGRWEGETYIGPQASATMVLGGSRDAAGRLNPRDPSVDSFIDRYGVWNMDDQMKKIQDDYRIDNEVDKKGNVKGYVPGTRTFRGVISDADPQRIVAGEQYAQLQAIDYIERQNKARAEGLKTPRPSYLNVNEDLRGPGDPLPEDWNELYDLKPGQPIVTRDLMGLSPKEIKARIQAAPKED